ncbi:MAG: indole-3-glycerol phosphate synthase TrpC, partial [Clostridiales bacterium]|nr:indole-3-glycerol phosphate synthase TrpC [Clostridiales bacterium]
MILDKINEKRKIQLENEVRRVSRADIKAMAGEYQSKNISFKKALQGGNISFICEVKKASPSKGLIREDFRPVEIAIEYEKAGASAISCLTEEHFFQGSSEFLRDIAKKVDIPILRKDFIFDEYQIYEAKTLGASAVLLIAAMLSKEQIKEFLDISKGNGFECLVEVHNEDELQMVLDCDCEIIGVNNRNLKTFEVSLDVTKRLASLIPRGKVIVSESGIATNEDMKKVKIAGADA